MPITCIEYNVYGQGRLIVVDDSELIASCTNVFWSHKNKAFEAFVDWTSDLSKQPHVLKDILLSGDENRDASRRPIRVVKTVNQKNMDCTEADVQDLFMFFAAFNERYGFSRH